MCEYLLIIPDDIVVLQVVVFLCSENVRSSFAQIVTDGLKT